MKVLIVSLVLSFLSTAPLADTNAPIVADSDQKVRPEETELVKTFTTRAALTDQELAALQKKIRKQNEAIIRKRIEQIRLEEEKRLEAELKKALAGKIKAYRPVKKKKRVKRRQDRVTLTQAAAQLTSTDQLPTLQKERKLKIIPFAGVSSYSADDESYESKVNTGVNVEMDLNQRFAAGAGIGYSTLDRQDIVATQTQFFGIPNVNQTEKFGFKRLNLNLNGKFYLMESTKIRPYLGAALGYNRSTVEFKQRTSVTNPFVFNPNIAKQTNEVTSSSITGTAILGVEMALNERIGINVDVNYARSFSNGFSENQNIVFNTNGIVNNSNYDEQRLNQVGHELSDASILAFNAGLIIRF